MSSLKTLCQQHSQGHVTKPTLKERRSASDFENLRAMIPPRRADGRIDEGRKSTAEAARECPGCAATAAMCSGRICGEVRRHRLRCRAAASAPHEAGPSRRHPGDEGATERLTELLSDVSLVPDPSPAGIQWWLEADPPTRLAARAALAWSRFAESTPGRLEACANSDCNLFFIDRSRPGTGKWCSMTTCGNRLKARAHANRQRTNRATEAH